MVVRQSGKPTKVTETRWHINQDPELLYQRAAGIFFELDEEEHITIIDVTKRIADNFHQNNEKVTKQFYDKFKKEHGAFLQFIKGISDRTNQEWYASLMLNRLMFCYFIQKKGFLDNNKNYLRDKLLACKAKKGKVKFYSFYRDFLLVLFHKGLNEPTQSPDTQIEIGKIPYLNGGLFDEHELEKTNASIDIDDKAFERLFDFFDQYEWHLDTRHTASGKDINPDVIGYIFEKYINDRANMGAYYTKEDITDYISKNCIIPFLFDETERTLRQAQGTSKTESKFAEVWQMLKESGDTYIYDAVKKGIDTEHLDFSTRISIDHPDHPLWADLPEEVRAGFRPDLKDKIVVTDDEPHLWHLRKEWNKPAPENIALPTEIYRELIDRRKRYWEIRQKIDNGEISHINDFITYNLNIRQFAQDVVENTNDPELLKNFYKALNSVTILDPTCGSGAFLFAAMNILEPLYESCLQRMENFVAEAPKGKYKFFEETLAQLKSPEHPNLQYFIYKSIILRNLYGVDIMKEAVEIAKLRLFLKLVATVDADYRKPNLGLEPLPDIDFNIRAGNTLIGYATKKEIDDLQGMFVTQEMKDEILEECDLVSRAFQRFKEIQLKGYENKKEFTKAKTELISRLQKLANNLNKILYKQHYESMDYEKWLETHQPFHWFAEYYEIVQGNGGFDVIIGNPPYVEYRKVGYTISESNFQVDFKSDIYAAIIERSKSILKKNGRISMIVPISIFSTEGFLSLQKFLLKSFSLIYVSNYADSAKLFQGITKRVSIVIFSNSEEAKAFYQTNYLKEYFNENLLKNISYQKLEKIYYTVPGATPKISSNIEVLILSKIFSNKNKTLSHYTLAPKKSLFFTRTLRNFCLFHIEKPFRLDNKNKKVFASEIIEIGYSTEYYDGIISVLNSNLFVWFYNLFSDMRHINKGLNNQFSIPSTLKNKLFANLSEKLMDSFEKNVLLRTPNANGIIERYYQPRKSKSIIDEIDTVLAQHYGFTDEELDFIINYDIKYRMGKELESEDEE
ncbi:MAG: Eco57I restriction-modification methylase domain-containing protein [Thermaurantimonas sp.]